MNLLKTLARTLVVLPLFALAACHATISERMGESLTVIRGFQSSDNKIPETVFAKAKGIAIIREGSGALIVGGSGGSGVFMKKAGMSWSAPVAVNTASLTVGLQAGGQERDIVIFMNTEEEVSRFLDDGVYALAEASAVAGPAKTDPKNAGGPVPSSYYYLRSKGLFGGLLVGGVHFTIDAKSNHETYGPDATVGEILSGKYPKPQGATILTQSLE
jgi:lipid-binding SYLF domain-containing protein